MAIGRHVSVQIAYDQMLTDNGTLSFASGDTLTFPNSASQIAVGGISRPPPPPSTAPITRTSRSTPAATSPRPLHLQPAHLRPV